MKNKNQKILVVAATAFAVLGAIAVVLIAVVATKDSKTKNPESKEAREHPSPKVNIHAEYQAAKDRYEEELKDVQQICMESAKSKKSLLKLELQQAQIKKDLEKEGEVKEHIKRTYQIEAEMKELMRLAKEAPDVATVPLITRIKDNDEKKFLKEQFQQMIDAKNHMKDVQSQLLD